MQTVTLEEAKAQLGNLIEAAAAGEEVFIQKNDGFSVQLVPRALKARRRQFGSARGLISMAPDFDAPLEEFREYME